VALLDFDASDGRLAKPNKMVNIYPLSNKALGRLHPLFQGAPWLSPTRLSGVLYGLRMDYSDFTTPSLLMMYEAARGALAAEEQGKEPKFKVRTTMGWKQHSQRVELELSRRRIVFQPISLSESQW